MFSGWNCTNNPSFCSLCGNSKIEPPNEQCEDGNLKLGDGCSSTCQIEAGFNCTPANASVCTPICGDGLLKGNETCDDNNTLYGDGCSANCSNVESGFDCIYNETLLKSVCKTNCSDGVIIGNEVCDDGS